MLLNWDRVHPAINLKFWGWGEAWQLSGYNICSVLSFGWGLSSGNSMMSPDCLMKWKFNFVHCCAFKIKCLGCTPPPNWMKPWKAVCLSLYLRVEQPCSYLASIDRSIVISIAHNCSKNDANRLKLKGFWDNSQCQRLYWNLKKMSFNHYNN